MKGFTLTELVLVVAIFGVLTSLATVNLFRTQTRASLDTSITTIISDLKQQQLKAMVGERDGKTPTPQHGIHFDAGSYVLFSGASYNNLDSSNAVIDLSDNISINGAPVEIIFARLSGEILASVNITVSNTSSGESKTINLNKYGVVSIN